MVHKTTVLTFVRYYLPGFKSGGPIRTIANLVAALGEEFEFRIVTSDRDEGDARAYADIRPDAWTRVGNAEVFYQSPQHRGLADVGALMRVTAHDVVYLNSFFDPDFTTKPLLAQRLGLAPRRPALLAPRGEFSDGALALKRLKKRTFLSGTRLTGLHSRVIWQASSAQERDDIERVMDGASDRIQVAMDIPDPAAFGGDNPDMARARAVGAPLRVCFLSRISEMKNLDFALEVLAGVDIPLTFHIYGPQEDLAYWDLCQRQIARLPSQIRVCYEGPVPHEHVQGVLADHDLFFVPSRGENYGHVFFEAFCAGLPVLTSDRTPWCDLEREGVGWTLALDDPQPFRTAIAAAAKWTEAERIVRHDRSVAYARRHFHEGDAVQRNRQMLRGAAGFEPDATREPELQPTSALAPVNRLANAAIQFHDTCASTWDAKYASGGFRKRAAFFERQVLPSLDRPGRWLDVGCGSGFFGRMLAAARGVRVTGVDASAPMIDAATAEAAAAGLAASVDFQRIESAERLPFAAGEFAGALCLSVLEYLGDPLAGLDELARVVAPGGALVVSVPHARSLVRAGQSIAAALGVRSWPYRTLSRFTLTEPALRRALRARGFESVHILRFDSVLPQAVLGLLAPSLIYAVARKSEGRPT